MFFKSYDGWKQFESQSGKMLIMAHFTKWDDSIVRYNAGAIQDKIQKRPPAMKPADIALLQQAIDEQCEFIHTFIDDTLKGRAKAQFTAAGGTTSVPQHVIHAPSLQHA